MFGCVKSLRIGAISEEMRCYYRILILLSQVQQIVYVSSIRHPEVYSRLNRVLIYVRLEIPPFEALTLECLIAYIIGTIVICSVHGHHGAYLHPSGA